MKSPEEIRERIKELEKALDIIGEQKGGTKDTEGNELPSITILWNLIVKEINTLQWVIEKEGE